VTSASRRLGAIWIASAGALLLLATPSSGAKPRGPSKAAAAHCDKVFERQFAMKRGSVDVRLRLVKPPPAAGKAPPSGQAAFEGLFQLCRALGSGWQVAPGSYSAGFLDEAKRAGSPELKAALAACPVTYRRVDTVCAPCVAGSRSCPCADRDVSDWIFCEHG
jgi:hypothetical protein